MAHLDEPVFEGGIRRDAAQNIGAGNGCHFIAPKNCRARRLGMKKYPPPCAVM
jgi:hypothetical protein